MDRGLFWTTFDTVFLAELGDKTQLAAMTASARSGALVSVFLAASAALICATAIGVAVGGVLSRSSPRPRSATWRGRPSSPWASGSW